MRTGKCSCRAVNDAVDSGYHAGSMLPTLNRSVVMVTPKQPFLDWLLSVDPASAEVAVEVVCKPVFYLLPACEDDAVLEEYVRDACKTIFEDQLDGWYRGRSRWPVVRNFNTFRLWFEYRADALVLDLGDELLRHD
jgi:hypothetical protein